MKTKKCTFPSVSRYSETQVDGSIATMFWMGIIYILILSRVAHRWG